MSSHARQSYANDSVGSGGAGRYTSATALCSRTGGAVLKQGSADEAAALLRTLGEEGRPVRPRGGGTKDWGPLLEDTAAVVETGGLARILEHNVGDFTAVLEAGVPLADARAEFARHGQMLAIDPALNDAATVGGVMAT